MLPCHCKTTTTNIICKRSRSIDEATQLHLSNIREASSFPHCTTRQSTPQSISLASFTLRAMEPLVLDSYTPISTKQPVGPLNVKHTEQCLGHSKCLRISVKQTTTSVSPKQVSQLMCIVWIMKYASF